MSKSAVNHVEFTPAMVLAGVETMFDWLQRDCDMHDCVAAIYIAMERTRLKGSRDITVLRRAGSLLAHGQS